MKSRQTLRHEAMATTYAVTVAHDDCRYARQAVAAAFDELDLIESRLSRYVETSDVSRVNRLGPGDSTLVHLDTFDCLSIASEMKRATDGAFDVSCHSRDDVEHEPGFALDEATHSVEVRSDELRIDLGGIGKGFALDRMAALLGDWDIDAALLCASTSTVLALGAPPPERGWPVHVGPDHDDLRLVMCHRAVAGSGTTVRGDHIVDPRSRTRAARWFRAWVAAPGAALADALSTACMVLSEDEIRACCARVGDATAYVQPSPSASLLTITPQG